MLIINTKLGDKGLLKRYKVFKKPLAENMEKVYNDMVRKRFRKIA